MRVRNTSSRHGTLSGRQCGRWNHWQAGIGKLRNLYLSYLKLQSAVRRKQVNLKNVESDSNMADLGTKVLEKDKIDRHMKNFGCVEE